MSPSEIAKILNKHDSTSYPYDTVVEATKEMLQAASRYRNLEKVLNCGICFVLGIGVVEAV